MDRRFVIVLICLLISSTTALGVLVGTFYLFLVKGIVDGAYPGMAEAALIILFPVALVIGVVLFVFSFYILSRKIPKVEGKPA